MEDGQRCLSRSERTRDRERCENPHPSCDLSTNVGVDTWHKWPVQSFDVVRPKLDRQLMFLRHFAVANGNQLTNGFVGR